MQSAKIHTRSFDLIDNQQDWDQLVQSSPDNHPLQLWGWGEQKANFGWKPYRIASRLENLAMQVLLKPIPKTGYFLGHVPRGPIRIVDRLSTNQTSRPGLQDIIDFLESIKVISLRLEPNNLESDPNPPSLLQYAKTYSGHVLTNHTLIVDLNKSIEELRSNMSNSCRYNVNKSAKQASVVSLLDYPEYYPDIYSIYQETARRAGFNLYTFDYYKSQLNNLCDNLDILISIDNKTSKPIAFLWNIYSKNITFELYAGVNSQGRKLRANYNLKYQAILRAKQRGQKVYDFNGRLNEQVDSFKRSFGPTVVDRMTTQKIVLSRLDQPFEILESLYRKIKRYSNI